MNNKCDPKVDVQFHKTKTFEDLKMAGKKNGLEP